MKGSAGLKLDRILTKSLVGADAENRRPSVVPTGAQADTLGLGVARVIEEVDVVPHSEFMFGVFQEARPSFLVFRIELEDLLIFQPRFACTAQQSQHPRLPAQNFRVRWRDC